MRIHELEIIDLRGIRHETLDLGAENIVIWGPNGSGKSAVVDAVDFLLRGSISRLEGEGAGSLSTPKHGPHVDASVTTAGVSALVSLPGTSEPFRIRRTMANPTQLELSNQDVTEELEAILDVAKEGQYVLARREILRFITSTGGSRAKWIQSLMRLDSLEDIRKTVGSAANDAKKVAKAADSALASERAAFCVTAAINGWTDEAALASINAARETLEAPAIASLEPELVSAGVTAQAVAKADANLVRFAQALKQLTEFSKTRLLGFRATTDSLSLSANALGRDVEALRLLQRHNLVHAGLKLLGEGGNCPLCGAEWDEGELESMLTKELQRSTDVAARRKVFEDLVDNARPDVATLQSLLTTAIETGGALELVGATSVLQDAANEIIALDAALATPTDKLGPKTADSYGVPMTVQGDYLIDEIARLSASVAELTPEITPEQAAWDLLTRLHDALTRIRNAQEDALQQGQMWARAEALRDAYVSAKDEVLNALYEAIKERFVDFYSGLHAEDGEDEFEALLQHDGASLDFQVDFFGRGLYPPHALHSEGHQDSMGICLYLALSEHVNQDVVGILVLDDVVMSVDAGHRKRLCRLLKEQFKDIQFIITTHDRGWAHQLRTEGVVKATGMIQFCGWSVEDGPRVARSDVWETIDRCLGGDDVRGAAGYLRGAMEEFFANVCENLQASVVYRGTAQHTLGDFLPAAYSRYLRLLRQAKGAASSWSDQEALDRFEEIESVASQCYSRTQAEQWVTNKGLHYDAWYIMEAADLRDVVDAFLDLCDVFQCPDCGVLLSVSVAGFEPDSVTCSCKKKFWNLAKKKP